MTESFRVRLGAELEAKDSFNSSILLLLENRLLDIEATKNDIKAQLLEKRSQP